MTLAVDAQASAPGKIVELFVLDASALGGEISRYHAGVNQKGTAVVWQGQIYTPFPIEASGFERSVNGALPRPILRIANINGMLGAMLRIYDDLVGAKVTRKRTLSKYLDAVNFPDGLNPLADTSAGQADEIWFIDRKSAEDKSVIEWELAAPWDVAGVKLPRRPFIANTCTWLAIGGYRGPYCSYAGPAVAKADDTPTNDLAQDRCGGRISSCKLRFGEAAELPYGGFPSCGLLRA